MRHSIGTAILTREILAIAKHRVDMEADYIAGLLHNLGIIIQQSHFDEIEQIHSKTYEDLNELIATEEDIIGWNHAKRVPIIYGIITYRKILWRQ